MKQTWIVVADGSKAQAYRYQGAKAPLERVDNGELQHINQLSQDLVSDKPGRAFQSVGSRRAGMEPKETPKEQEKHAFAREICAYLNAQMNKIDNLILVAAPRMLGDLRQFLSNSLKHKVSGEISKDLTNLPASELPQHLQHVLNIAAHPMQVARR